MDFTQADITNKLETADVQKLSSWILHEAPETIRNNPYYVGIAVARNLDIYEHLSHDLKHNPLLVSTAVKRGLSLCDFSEFNLQNDRAVILAVVHIHGRELRFVEDDMKRDREVVMTAVQQDWRALRFADQELKGDKQVVMTAVQQNGRALQYASDELKMDRKVVKAAVSQTAWAIDYASGGLREDDEILAVAMPRSFIKPAQGKVVIEYRRMKGHLLATGQVQSDNAPEEVTRAMTESGLLDIKSSAEFQIVMTDLTVKVGIGKSFEEICISFSCDAYGEPHIRRGSFFFDIETQNVVKTFKKELKASGRTIGGWGHEIIECTARMFCVLNGVDSVTTELWDKWHSSGKDTITSYNLKKSLDVRKAYAAARAEPLGLDSEDLESRLQSGFYGIWGYTESAENSSKLRATVSLDPSKTEMLRTNIGC